MSLLHPLLENKSTRDPRQPVLQLLNSPQHEDVDVNAIKAPSSSQRRHQFQKQVAVGSSG